MPFLTYTKLPGVKTACALYRQEIEEALRVGAVTEVMTAFSRSVTQMKKEYVQSKVRP